MLNNLKPNRPSKSEVRTWLESPVSRRLVELISEHLEANKLALAGTLLGYKPEDLESHIPDMILYKGQIHTLELLSDLEVFLEVSGEPDEKIQTINEQVNYQDS